MKINNSQKSKIQAATVVINQRAIRHNLQQIRYRSPKSHLIAIVKANAYGHGILEIAYMLHDVEYFGVSRIGEALILRSGGISKPILLLEGFISSKDLPVLVEQNIETVVHSGEQLTALEQAELAHPIQVWMKLDIGMHRLGVRLEQAENFYQRLCSCHNVSQPVNLISHLSCADEPRSEDAIQQMGRFNRFSRGKKGKRSIASSIGTLLWPNSDNDWIRPGIILYGVWPLDIRNGGINSCLHPVMTLKSSLIAVREHLSGESVGYNGSWVSQRNTRLGVVAIGYGDGYPRSASNGTPVWLNGREVPIVGFVSMDMLSVDLGPNATDQVGDEVILWGPELPAERIAICSGISVYELITRLTQRVEMKYIDD